VASIDIVERAGRLLWETAQSPSKVILFGSHARGEPGPDSDLDLLVVERELSSRRAERLRLRRALRGLGVPVDLIVVSEEQVAEWGEVEGTMLHTALTEGRVLVE
jgi:predicted nucleotidyltransferase